MTKNDDGNKLAKKKTIRQDELNMTAHECNTQLVSSQYFTENQNRNLQGGEISTTSFTNIQGRGVFKLTSRALVDFFYHFSS